MKSQNPSNRKTYYRKSQFNSLVLFAISLVFIILAKSPAPLIILISLVVIFIAYSAIQIRLVISPEAIEYYQVGYSVRTTWKNIAQIGEVPAGRIMAEGLILNEPALFVHRWFAGIKYIQTRGKVIPLSLFKNDWVESELGQDIKKYAPHLFARK